MLFEWFEIVHAFTIYMERKQRESAIELLIRLWQNEALVKQLAAQCFGTAGMLAIQAVKKHLLNACHVSGYFCEQTKLLSWTSYSGGEKQPHFSKLTLQ